LTVSRKKIYQRFSLSQAKKRLPRCEEREKKPQTGEGKRGES